MQYFVLLFLLVSMPAEAYTTRSNTDNSRGYPVTTTTTRNADSSTTTVRSTDYFGVKTEEVRTGGGYTDFYKSQYGDTKDQFKKR